MKSSDYVMVLLFYILYFSLFRLNSNWTMFEALLEQGRMESMAEIAHRLLKENKNKQ